MAGIRIDKVSWSDAQDALSSIRRIVFIEEQAVPEDLEWDGEDEQALQLLVTEGDEAIGCGRMLADGHIGRMAVLKAYRGRGAGRLILKTLLMQAEKLKRSRVSLNAQTRAAGFYAKYGFTRVGGEFPDANIPHVRMEKTLDNFSETLNSGFAIPGRLRGTIKDGELFLVDAHISPYSHGNRYNPDPLRTRELLLHKKEIRRLIGKVQERGFTLIPLRL